MGRRAIATKREARSMPAAVDDGHRAAMRMARDRAAESGQKLAIAAARLADDEKCEDVIVLDLRGVSMVCDYFVIATGTSDRQLRAVAINLEKETSKSLNDKPYRISGYEDGTWIIVDYVDVVIHLFDAERRLYYDLESLWGDCPKIEWQR